MIDTSVLRSTRDPVFVRATAPGTGGIAVIVLDGDGALSMLERIVRCQRRLLELADGDAAFGKLFDASGRAVDEIVISTINRKKSATGNPQIELSCHGGEGLLQAVESVLLEAGFYRGRSTELLERAHLHGKMSLLTIESRLRQAAAVTARQAEFLLNYKALQEKWERLGFDLAMGMRTRELSWREKLYVAAEESIAQSHAAMALLGRHHVVIVGPVNAGKSTLANRLMGIERNIVSEIPGTTIDRLDAPIALRGLNVLLSDTAGWRKGGGAVESEGQRRAKRTAQEAGLRLIVLDASAPPAEHEIALAKEFCAMGPALLVLNKQDLGVNDEAAGLGFLLGREPLLVSAQSGAGVDVLQSAIEHELLGNLGLVSDAPFTKRQVALITNMRRDLKTGVEGERVLLHLRKLIGTRPDADELNSVLAEE